jgi:hypothetical protein
MTATTCTYSENRDSILIDYLYGEIEPADRAAFHRHLAACATCRSELAELGDVRSMLGNWAPPERSGQLASVAPARRGLVVWATLREIPAWAQVAAAVLVLGVAAGAANLDVRYSRDGLTVRTGWSKAPAPVAADKAGDAAAAPWRADLASFEQRLRAELKAEASASAAGAREAEAQPSLTDAMRRVRTLVEESERRQQRELALRVAEIVRDVNAQRQADLVRIDGNLRFLQSNTGAEALRQRQMLNMLAIRTSQRQ